MVATDIRDITSFKWATVVGVDPIAIRLDGDSLALALIPDSLVDPLSLAVGHRVRVELSLRKCVIHGVSNGGDVFDSGDIVSTARSTARPGWLLCQGQSLSRSAYPRLFAAIGTDYGAVNSTSFSIPDARGRVLVGFHSGVAEFNALGKTGGVDEVKLTAAQSGMPSHTHGYNTFIKNWAVGTGQSGNGRGMDNSSGQGAQTEAASANASQAHTNLQPYIALNYMIKI